MRSIDNSQPFVLDFKPGITSCHYKNCSYCYLLCLNATGAKKSMYPSIKRQLGLFAWAQAKSWACQIIGGITDIFGNWDNQDVARKMVCKTSRLHSIWSFGPWLMCIALLYSVDCMLIVGILVVQCCTCIWSVPSSNQRRVRSCNKGSWTVLWQFIYRGSR